MKDLLTKLLDPMKEAREELQAKKKLELEQAMKKRILIQRAKARAIAKNGQ